MANIREHVSLGDRGQATTPPRRPRRWSPARGPPRGPARAARASAGAGPPRRAGRRRRHRRHPGGAELADAGKQVYLVEREPTHRRPHGQVRQDLPHARLRGLHPHAEDVRGAARTRTSRCGPTRRSSSVEGFVGNFTVKVRAQPRYVDEDLCTGCLECIEPASTSRRKFADEFERGAGQAQADLHPVPAGHAAGRRRRPRGVHLVQDAASASRPASRPASATPSTSTSRTETFDESRSARSSWPPASRPSTPRRMPDYGYGQYPNVYTSLEFERL